MATRKASTARRREVRRSLKPQTPGWQAWALRPQWRWSAVLFAVFVAVAGLMAVHGQSRPHYRSEQVADRTMVARVRFEAIDETQTQKQRDDKYANEAAVYAYNAEYFDRLGKLFDGLIAPTLDPNIQNAKQIHQDLRQSFELTDGTLSDLRRYVEPNEFTDEEGKAQTGLRTTQNWREQIDQFLFKLATTAILTPPRARLERDEEKTRSFRIKILHPKKEITRVYSTIFSVDDEESVLRANISPLATKSWPEARIQRSVVALVMNNLDATYVYDEDQTKLRKQAAYDSVADVIKQYNRDDVLAQAGEKLTPFDIQVLEQERFSYLRSLSPTRHWLTQAGSLGIVLIVALTLWAYLSAYAPRITSNPMRGLALVALLLLCQALAVFPAFMRPEFIYAIAIFPALMAATVLAIAYDQRLALAVGALLSLLICVTLGESVGFAIVLLTAVGVAVSLLGEVRTRSKLVQVGLVCGLATAAAIWCVGLAERRIDLEGVLMTLLYDSVFGLITGIVTGMFTQGILPLVEKVFHVTTSMTLKDLNDASHPLLRRLAEQAPGTYAHSLRMADMGESAADAIGANGLLCRVGAMYHDIGKTNKPIYFVENQAGGPNRHTKLSPAMSVLIIVGHVKDGVEMAREYRLPMALRHFIESHHGTTLVEYFYHAAVQQHEGQGKETPQEFEFRYPGPRPATREAAILMICDAVEGAARAISDPNPARLEQLVHQMAMRRLMDGQFDDCNLTLQELHRIEAAITKTVRALYHGRIAYPSDKKEPARSAPQSVAS